MSAPPGKKESGNISMEIMRYWGLKRNYYGNNPISSHKDHPEDHFSEIEHIGGYPWEDYELHLEVLCHKSKEAELWQCNAEITRNINQSRINQESKMYEFSSWGNSKVAIDDEYSYGEQINVMITTNTDGNKWTIRHPCSPSIPFDGTIVIGEEKKKLQVRREDFVQLIQFAYGQDFASPSKYLRMETAGLNVYKMLELAERFQLKIVQDRIVSFLLSPFSSLSIHKKLLLSDKFNIPFLKNHMLNRYTKAEVIELGNLAEFSQLSPDSLQVLLNKGCIDAFPANDVPSTRVVDSISVGEPNIVMRVKENGESDQFSPVYRVNGFPWRLRFDRSNPHVGIVSLICDKSSEAALWKCTATISSKLGGRSYVSKLTFNSWDANSHEQRLLPTIKGAFSLKATIETVEDGESYSRRPIPFTTSNGILVFGQKKIEVNKESLASQSPFFDRLFFGDFKEKNMKEIPIGDVDCEEFTNLMAALYGYDDNKSLNCNNAERMLQLADRFELKIVEDRVVSYLLSPSSSLFSPSKKLLISELYNLPFLKIELISQFKSIDELKELSESRIERFQKEWKQLSKETLRILFKKFCV